MFAKIRLVELSFQIVSEKESETLARYTKLTSEFNRQLELLHQQSRGKVR